MELLERFEGDFGPNARFTTTVTDALDAPVTSGVRLVIASLVAGPWDGPGTPLVDVAMTHLGSGQWEWVPEEGDLAAGWWSMQVTHPDVASPSHGFGRLLVRQRLPVAEET